MLFKDILDVFYYYNFYLIAFSFFFLRHKRKHTSVLKFGLRKLLEFLFEVMSVSVCPWRLIIERFGRLGQGELKTWASLLSRKSLHSYSKKLREMCGQCSISGVADVPCILSACLVSLEPDSTLRLMPDQIRIVERFGCSRSKNCHLSTPEDASCTHILVFPTSATTQVFISYLYLLIDLVFKNFFIS